jgi:hypothetical protein
MCSGQNIGREHGRGDDPDLRDWKDPKITGIRSGPLTLLTVNLDPF